MCPFVNDFLVVKFLLYSFVKNTNYKNNVHHWIYAFISYDVNVYIMFFVRFIQSINKF